MPNTAVLAAAEGMPQINRRRLLLGLAAASTAAATGTVALAAEAAPAENPELIRLGEELPGIVEEYQTATTVRRAIIKKWLPKWPVAPDELLGSWSGFGSRNIERDLLGRGIDRENSYGEKRCREIYTTKDLQRSLEWADQGVRRARTDRTRANAIEKRNKDAALLVVAKRYEATCQAIRDASGYEAANARREAVTKRLLTHVEKVLLEQAVTMAGVIIQAQALVAAGGIKPLYRWSAEATSEVNWSERLAASILRQAEGGAS
ncbi:hypothetical protein [Pseudaminobacter soli (ex Li et al. 2025)]|uniref:Uncharacterized protein n=1 Tax=Pseudaminobacter soli (ex Li et al. 2025) TaxID=1295366 RepID=A0A2P7S4P2_9HYPH|nr:hypothetical protein [Mesorhizobium soli]PSJ57402.1 hypothetical protein C7I85_22725 [Mesorhizobium soli]